MVVRGDETHVVPWWCNDAGYLVRALVRRCPWRALGHVVLGDVAANAEHAVDGVGVDVL